MTPSTVERLRSFYVEYRQQLYTYAISITHQRESAEDAIQHAFQKLLRHDLLPTDLRPYLFRSVRNAAVDGLRRYKKQLDPLFEESITIENEDGAVPAVLSAPELDQLLRALSGDERETIVLKIFDGFSFQEIADLRDVPLATAASWYRRGLAKMKTILAKQLP